MHVEVGLVDAINYAKSGVFQKEMQRNKYPIRSSPHVTSVLKRTVSERVFACKSTIEV